LLAGIRSRLTYANVMATVAVFIALGGAAWAAATINSGDVVNDSLKSVDLKDDKAVKGVDVKDLSLTGLDLGEAGFAFRDFDSIPAHSCTGLTVSSPNVVPDNLVVVHAAGTIGSDYAGSGGLVVTGSPGAGTWTIKVCNVTAGPINPPDQQFGIWQVVPG
jgi:hypothetical protein